MPKHETKLRVTNCPLCNIFEHLNINTKLYFPTLEEIQKQDDFVIIDCQDCQVPMVVVSEHVTEIGKEQWGRILYQSRRLFGNIVLRPYMRKIKDHWHRHIIKWSKDPRKAPDLRFEDGK